jgi:hypothetical protein
MLVLLGGGVVRDAHEREGLARGHVGARVGQLAGEGQDPAALLCRSLDAGQWLPGASRKVG